MGLAVGLLVLYTLFFGARQPVRAGAAGGDVLIGRLHGALATQAAKGETAEEPADAGDAKTTPKAGQQKPIEESDPVVWGSDPFVRDWLLINELAELNLRAITVGGDKAYVLINDQILEEGDVISGKRIVTIESDRVILEQGGRKFTLVLGE
jgi:hypothetical protein